MERYKSAERLRSALTGGERLLWSGEPRQGIVFRFSDLLSVPFSLVWGGFMMFVAFDMSSEGTPFFFRLWGIFLFLFVFYMIAGRFLWDSWRRAHTVYGLTDHRVLIISSSPWRRVASVALNTLTELTLSPRGNGGTITFGPAPPFSLWSNSWPGGGTKQSPAFELASDIHRVYEMVVSAQSEVRLAHETDDGAAAVAPPDEDSFDSW